MTLLVFITHAEKLVQVFLEVNFEGAHTKYFSVQRFENAFQRDLSRVKWYGSSGETAFFVAYLEILHTGFCN